MTGTSEVNGDAFTEKTVEVTETNEEAVVAKTARIAEAVVIHKEVEQHVETVRDTVRVARENQPVVLSEKARAQFRWPIWLICHATMCRKSALSSISQTPCRSAIAATSSSGNGFPSVCAAMIAFVRGPIAASTSAGTRLYVPSSTSTKMGTSRLRTIGLTVVGKPAATVTTSSPGTRRRSPSLRDVSADTASRFADEPELQISACRTPSRFASSSSNLLA